MEGYNTLRKKCLKLLSTQLSKDLCYHGIHHTLDVLKVINQYIKREKVKAQDAKLLRIGALLHDIGFTVSYTDHELRSVETANKLMSELGFSKEHIKTVNGLILSTRVPQKPKNILEKIICDSDLDYLGRSDFYSKSNLLFKELKTYASIESKLEWNKIQVKFLKSHKYHTKFANKYRQPQKIKRILEIEQQI